MKSLHRKLATYESTDLCNHVLIFTMFNYSWSFLFFSDPELIYDKMKLYEDGLHDVIDIFPKDFSLKQFRPDMSGMAQCERRILSYL